MKSSLLMNFSVDKESRKINVQREFAAPIDDVWSAWTESKWLDQWWAPQPWKTKTKSLDFREGGRWLYAMVGPQGEQHWCRADYQSISPIRSFSYTDAFCDENGNVTDPFPQSTWVTRFGDEGDSTMVSIEISYQSVEDLEKVIEMGFREGLTASMENLDEILRK